MEDILFQSGYDSEEFRLKDLFSNVQLGESLNNVP